MHFSWFRKWLFLLILLGLTEVSLPQATRRDYFKIIQQSVEYNFQECDHIIQNWKANLQKSNLFGYSPLSYPANFAELLGFMYQRTGEEKYVKKAVEMLLVYEELKTVFPREFYENRAEYRRGLPPLSDFFSMYSYPKAYWYIQKNKSIPQSARETIERGIADCANYLMIFPEWGPMNRAILRAETFYYAAMSIPQHPDAAQWRQMAQVLFSDSYQRWEEEDATGYHGVWLLSLMRMVDVRQDQNFYRSAIPRYYFDYFTQLITPAGLIPDFGDAQWPSDTYRFLAIFEKAAAVYQEPRFKWAANQIWQNMLRSHQNLRSAYGALSFIDAWLWADDRVTIEPPPAVSNLCQDDLVGKKILFRNGVDSMSTYLLVNYRDEGEGAYAGREFLRSTIAAEEEKTHHGHADENSIVSLFFQGSILLHDAGYRDQLPSGEYGRFRADYYHNRIVTRKNKRWVQIEGEYKAQDLWEFLRNSGAYRPVQTQLINFLTFQHVDYSRSRLRDPEMGYEWDRSVIYHKKDQFFVVVDAVKTLRDDFFTHTNLWHTRKIVRQGRQWFDTEIDSIRYSPNKTGPKLLICFPVQEALREYGTFNIQRHWQHEIAIYETVPSHYYAGDFEIFVTILFPHASTIDPETLVRRFEILPSDRFPKAIGLKYTNGSTTEYFAIKGDLRIGYLPENVRPRYTWESGKVSYGPFATDGEFLFGSVNSTEVYYAGANMTKIAYLNQTLQESAEMSFGLQFDRTDIGFGRPKWRYWENTTPVK